ncbi:heterokaryon incompatibility protein-domain-containing protein [Hypoxylon sp. FL0543]|nr:heterokaryon incompatibility protein-domain-containing protein [Hypoxylon sp. FL0543]
MTTAQCPDERGRQTSIYTPLDRSCQQVRLIQIEPSTGEDEPVRCRLDVVELKPDVRYAALSYVWGDPTITEDIIVNDVRLRVTVNLEAALRQFRKTGLPVDSDIGNVTQLWVDAICINQKNTQERNHQVKLMASIYSKATYVISWLGNPDEHRADLAIQTIRELTRALTDAIENPGDVSSYDRERLRRVAVEWILTHLGSFTVGKEPEGIHWRALTEFTSNEYWSRMWIIQEIVLAKPLEAHWYICGDESMCHLELHALQGLLGILRDSNLPGSDVQGSQKRELWSYISNHLGFNLFERRIRWLATLSALNPRRLRLVDAIHFSAYGAFATDARDFVYAVISLADSNIEPDYNKSVRDVYLDAVLSDGITNCVSTCLRHSGSGYGLENNRMLPSWLADFSNLRIENVTSWIARKAFMSGIDLNPPEVVQRDTLRIQGVAHNRVRLVKPLRSEYSPVDRRFFQQLCVEYLLELSEIDFTSDIFYWCLVYKPLQELVDALGCGDDLLRDPVTIPGIEGMSFSKTEIGCICCLALADDLADDDKATAVAKLNIPSTLTLELLLFVAFAGSDAGHILDNLAKLYDRMGLDAAGAFEAIMDRAKSRTLFKTDGGHLGIGPPNLQRGDLVCSLDRAVTTSLLRQRGSKWEHVGPCYVSKLEKMDVAEMIQQGKARVETFDIC